MALPSSGKISITDILTEMRQPTRTKVSLNTLASEWYNLTRNSVFNASEHKLSDWYGKSWSGLVAVSVSISPSFVDVASVGGVYDIKVICSQSWSATIISGASYSSLSNTLGTGNGDFQLKVSGLLNGVRENRGEVRVVSGGKSVSLEWIQKGSYISEIEITKK
jgi:hypothetical protein